MARSISTLYSDPGAVINVAQSNIITHGIMAKRSYSSSSGGSNGRGRGCNACAGSRFQHSTQQSFVRVCGPCTMRVIIIRVHWDEIHCPRVQPKVSDLTRLTEPTAQLL
ncbi:hypothetical protein KQX54_008261 [Cotesia glomerata]|uniref:Uncharacterized protein n=1 Tax=Cotesia glomerata TaxID=32391 RepID=A0AAV7J771_COTGL|nr:hypothetical protein KQX54_008261 [Cotesia glomerata]